MTKPASKPTLGSKTFADWPAALQYAKQLLADRKILRADYKAIEAQAETSMGAKSSAPKGK